MELYRITSERYAQRLDASGRPNRWNLKNQYVIYAASSRSLATLELVAHRNAIMGGVNYKMVVIHMPEDEGMVQQLNPKLLLPNWHLLENYAVTQQYGSNWYLEKKHSALQVPSAIIPQEYNYVINTVHPDFYKFEVLSIEDFVWDKRLL